MVNKIDKEGFKIYGKTRLFIGFNKTKGKPNNGKKGFFKFKKKNFKQEEDGVCYICSKQMPTCKQLLSPETLKEKGDCLNILSDNFGYTLG